MQFPRLALLAVFGVLACATPAPGFGAELNERVTLQKDEESKFPAFQVSYLGEKRVMHNKIHGTSQYHAFLVKAGDEEQVVTWNPKTQENTPAHFTFGGKKYLLKVESYSAETGRVDFIIRRGE